VWTDFGADVGVRFNLIKLYHVLSVDAENVNRFGILRHIELLCKPDIPTKSTEIIFTTQNESRFKIY
jgi:hypothetical protein